MAYLERYRHFTPFLCSVDDTMAAWIRGQNLCQTSPCQACQQMGKVIFIRSMWIGQQCSTEHHHCNWAPPLLVLGTRHLCMKGSWVPVHNISIPIIPSGGKVELAYHYLNVRSEDDQTPISCAADPEKLMEHRTQDSIFTKGQYPQAHSTTLYHLTARPCQFLIVYCLLPPSKKCLSRAEPIVTDFNQ